MADFLPSIVRDVSVRTRFTPSVTFQPYGQGGSGSGMGQMLMGLLQPEVTVGTAAGPVVFSPYGSPPEDYLVTVALAAAFGIGIFVGCGVLYRRVFG